MSSQSNLVELSEDSDINSLIINQLIEQISQITKSVNKDDFIKSYHKTHEQIKQIDEILYKPTILNQSLDIKELFEMLKQYDDILEKGNITVSQYKNMLDLVNLLDAKLKNSFIDVKELKDS